MSRSGHATDLIIQWSTAAVVVGVAAVAAYVSYNHAYELVAAHGETGETARVVPLTVDGLVYASSMVLLDSARHKRPTPQLARWLLGLGIAATLTANVAHGAGGGPIGAIVAAWPAVALVGSYELLMALVRGGVQRSTPANPPQYEQNTPHPEKPSPDESANGENVRRSADEYEQNGEDSQENDAPETDSDLITARAIAEQYWRNHQRWIPRDELRTQMHCASKRATELLRELKKANLFENR